MRIRFRPGYRHRFFEMPRLVGVLGFLAFVVLGCAGLQPPADPSQTIRLSPGRSSSGTIERIDFTMPYRLTYEATGRLQIESEIFPKRRLASLTVWLTAYGEDGRSLETFVLYHSGYRTGYKSHGDRMVTQTFSVPDGTEAVRFSSISTKKESR